jgi:mRNA interferase RelE/StbE
MTRVVLQPKAKKYFRQLKEPLKGRIYAGLEKLKKDPREGDIQKMQGEVNIYRLRIGDYRVIFTIENKDIIVTKIAPRGEVYKRG